MLSYGVDVLTNKAVDAIGRNNVTLKDGASVDADLVLLSMVFVQP